MCVGCADQPQGRRKHRGVSRGLSACEWRARHFSTAYDPAVRPSSVDGTAVSRSPAETSKRIDARKRRLVKPITFLTSRRIDDIISNGRLRTNLSIVNAIYERDKNMTIDFTALPRRNKTYAGANGSKISVMYAGEQYMIKFPAPPSKNKEMSYTHSCISEYLGCQIFNSIGIPAQKTILGTFNINGKEKIVVACGDFTTPGVTLQDFASLKNQIIDSGHNGYGTELSDILHTFENQTAIDQVAITERFWDMFIVDALIGNWDRHNGNWGFLYNAHSDTMQLAPVYDCGSSLYPQADDDIMTAVLTKEAEMNLRIFEIPTSAICLNGKRLKYFDFITSLQNEDCNQALRKILPRIDMDKIRSIINETPFISELQKRFYIAIIEARKARILDFAFERLN